MQSQVKIVDPTDKPRLEVTLIPENDYDRAILALARYDAPVWNDNGGGGLYVSINVWRRE
jgi:hypothetical protein